MKKLSFLIAFCLVVIGASAQLQNPVIWSFTSKKIDATTYELHMTANIDHGWHIYTIDHTADIGVATSVNLKNNPLATASGKLKIVGKPVQMKDPSTGEMVKFYENKVDIVQVVKLKSPVKTTFSGEVEFMACDDKQCLPPTTKEFKIALQ